MLWRKYITKQKNPPASVCIPHTTLVQELPQSAHYGSKTILVKKLRGFCSELREAQFCLHEMRTKSIYKAGWGTSLHSRVRKGWLIDAYLLVKTTRRTGRPIVANVGQGHWRKLDHCPSVRLSIGPSVRRSVSPSVCGPSCVFFFTRGNCLETA